MPPELREHLPLMRRAVLAVAVSVLGAGLVAAVCSALPATAAVRPSKLAAATASTSTTSTSTTTTTAPASTTTVAPSTTTSTTAPATTSTTAAPATTSTTAAAPSSASSTSSSTSTSTGSTGPSTAATGMLIGIRNPGATDPYSLAAVAAWQGKTNAVAQTYVRSTWTPAAVIPAVDGIWNRGSVPSISYDLQVSNLAVAAGEIDANLDAVAAAMKTWLAGPDGVYANGDDRRAYFRPAWEGNGNWYRWAPCYYAGGAGTAADYQAMWRHLHDHFTAAGIDSGHLAWIFSVNSADKVAACTAESLYPGDAYVDWTGIDGYTGGTASTPSSVFTTMAGRLRTLAPSKPLSIDEWGADSLVSAGKSAWIDAFFTLARSLDVRMNLVFDIDKEKDWAVFGGGNGDTTFVFGGATYRTWDSYRRNVANSAVIGSDRGNPRLLTDAQFLGRDA
jgi:beta-mannanase